MQKYLTAIYLEFAHSCACFVSFHLRLFYYFFFFLFVLLHAWKIATFAGRAGPESCGHTQTHISRSLKRASLRNAHSEAARNPNPQSQRQRQNQRRS